MSTDLELTTVCLGETLLSLGGRLEGNGFQLLFGRQRAARIGPVDACERVLFAFGDSSAVAAGQVVGRRTTDDVHQQSLDAVATMAFN